MPLTSETSTLIAEQIHSNGICIIPGCFDKRSVNELLAVFEMNSHRLQAAGIGKGIQNERHAEVRNDSTAWIEKGHHLNSDSIFFDPLDELIISINRRCYLGLCEGEFHFARYSPGQFYKRHRDSFSNDDARKITVILYLNSDWKKGDGGELCIFSDGMTTVEPRGGTLVVFESHIEHEVLPAIKERISLTGWLKNKSSMI